MRTLCASRQEFQADGERDDRRFARPVSVGVGDAAVADQRADDGDLPSAARAHRVEGGIDRIRDALDVEREGALKRFAAEIAGRVAKGAAGGEHRERQRPCGLDALAGARRPRRDR